MLPTGHALRALLAVADPADLAACSLPPINVSGGVAWAWSALGDIATTVLPAPCSGERATLAAITAAVPVGVAICWLVGAAVHVNGKPCLISNHFL